jgi:hypothetical protein
VNITGTVITAAAVLTLAACGSSSASSQPASTPTRTPAHTATPLPPPGQERYLAVVRRAGLGNRDVAGASDKKLLRLGGVICDGLDTSLGYQNVIRAVQGGHHITTRQATILTDAAIRNLCPAHLNEMPAGAP